MSEDQNKPAPIPEWRGYPVAQHWGDQVAEHLGHHLEITRHTRWNQWTTWDAFVDDVAIGANFDQRGQAKLACVEHAKKLEIARIVQNDSGTAPDVQDVQTH